MLRQTVTECDRSYRNPNSQKHSNCFSYGQFLLLVWAATANNGRQPSQPVPSERDMFTIWNIWAIHLFICCGSMPRFLFVPWNPGPGWNWKRWCSDRMINEVHHTGLSSYFLGNRNRFINTFPLKYVLLSSVEVQQPIFTIHKKTKRWIFSFDLCIDSQIPNFCFRIGNSNRKNFVCFFVVTNQIHILKIPNLKYTL